MTKRTSIPAILALAATFAVAVAAAAPGRLDPGFGTGGVVTTATAPGTGADFQNGMAIQTDRMILVGGESELGAAAGGFQWRISRYTHKGAVDTTFGNGGTVLTSMSSTGGFDELIWELALQPEGKIVAAGEAVTAAVASTSRSHASTRTARSTRASARVGR